MKIKNILAIILAFTFAFGFCSCRNIGADNSDYVTSTDAQGNVYTIPVITSTDADGNVFTIPDPDARPETTLNKAQQAFIDSITDPAKQDEYFEKDTAKLENSKPINTDNMEVIDVPKDEEGKPIHEGQQNIVENIEKADNYTIAMTIQTVGSDNEKTTMSVTTMKRGDDIYAKTQLPTGEGTYLPISLLVLDGKATIYLDSLRAYMSVPQDTCDAVLEEMKVGLNQESTAEFVQSGTIDVNGVVYTVDIYRDGDIEIKNFYLDGQLKRSESKASDGSSTIVEYSQISETVDSSKFIAPKGYMDMTTLLDSEAFGDLFVS